MKYTNIFEYVTEEEVFNRYFIKVELKKKFTNPLRPEDVTPGCFYQYFKGRLYFVDFGSTKTHYTAVDIVMMLFNLDFKDAINLIKRDFNINFKATSFNPNEITITDKVIAPSKFKHQESEESEIVVYTQAFNDRDLKYWKQYGISLSTLKKYNVYSALIAYINDTIFHVYTTPDPMYAYQEMDLYKLYRPFGGRKKKWRTNFKGGILEGYTQLPETGEILIITKSRKDVMTLYEMDISSVAVKSETSIASQNAIDILKSRFQKIYMIFDNDEAGINGAIKMSREYGIQYFFIDKHYDSKDISDFVKNHGFEKAQNFIYEKLFH
jgi:hypothetical protein